jgi:tyrosine-protein phosphatase YwqE
MASEPLNFKELLFEMQMQSYQPVIAHPERYIYHEKNKEFFEELKSAGYLFQLNIMSLTGHYGEPVRHAARELISQGMIDFLGSDLHREKHLFVIEAARKTQEYSLLLASGKLLNDTL